MPDTLTSRCIGSDWIHVEMTSIICCPHPIKAADGTKFEPEEAPEYDLGHDSVPAPEAQSGKTIMVPPRYPGGTMALERLIVNRLPKSFAEKLTEGTYDFDVSLVVDTKGYVDNVSITGALPTSLANNVKYTIKNTTWEPGYSLYRDMYTGVETKTTLDWPLTLRDLRIVIKKKDEPEKRRPRSKAVFSAGDFVAVTAETNVYSEDNDNSRKIEIQDGRGGMLPLTLERGRVVEVIRVKGDYVKVRWDASATGFMKEKFEQVNEGYVPLERLAKPEKLPADWLELEFTTSDGTEISFESGDDTVTSMGMPVKSDNDVVRIGYAYTIVYIGGEPYISTYSVEIPAE
ncbi:MAG: hypothetical protein NC193_07885 [bacterium]|nr:hypothetical protein [bacterium]